MNTEVALAPIWQTSLDIAIGRARNALDQAVEALSTSDKRITPTPIAREVFAKAVLKGRRRRKTFLCDIDFGEPAWDMLLELYVARAEGKPMGVCELCVASDVPATTALRWIAKLEAAGQIMRAAHPRNKRQYVLRLTDTAFHAVDGWLRWMIAMLG